MKVSLKSSLHGLQLHVQEIYSTPFLFYIFNFAVHFIAVYIYVYICKIY